MNPHHRPALRGAAPRRRLAVLAGALALGLALWLVLGLAAALRGADADAATLFDVSWWAQQAGRLLAWQQQSPALFLAGFMLTFVLLSALALPGCAALSLLAGSAFGTLAGTLLVGLASTLGALLAFLAARHWARERVQHRLGHRLQGLDALLSRHGAPGLVGLRLLPVLPYPVLNPLLALLQGLPGRHGLWLAAACSLLLAATLAARRRRAGRAG